MKLTDKNMVVEIDERTGYTTSIQSTADKYKMNWILDNSDFGKVDGFEVCKCDTDENGIQIFAENKQYKLSLVIKKQLGECGYSESYTFTNHGITEWFVNKDSFGIHFPFACQVKGGEDFHEKTCVSHLWCGDDVCWMYSSKLSGADLHLVINMTEGGISDYTISRDRAREWNGANYRGDFVLNPSPKTVFAGSSVTYTFKFGFTDGNPIDALCENDGFIHLSADKYTATVGEEINFAAYCKDGLQDLAIVHNGESISAKLDGNNACWTAAFEKIGEQKFYVQANGKKTYIVVNVIEDIDTILKKRTKFIANKQQYHEPESKLYGAYLCYDRDTDALHYVHNDIRTDHNASRERIGMGIAVLKQLQREYDEELFASITKHREFVERELFDEQTCIVYNEVERNNSWRRIYNFPWMSIYFYEWFMLTKEQRFLEYAAKIILKYYEFGGSEQESQGIEACRIITALKEQGLTELAEKFRAEFLTQVENIYKLNFASKSEEIGYVNEMPNCSAMYLLQGYILTGEKKYLDEAEKYVAASKSFYGFQPDYHLNMVCVRHWDRFWFGRYAEYGDVFPHYWSVLTAEMFYWYQKATGTDCKKEIDTIIGANLCIFMPDGFASNNYLYPYKVNVFSSTGEDVDFAGFGTFYGKRFDERANDQDWVLYYATVLK